MPKATKVEKDNYFFPEDVWFNAVLTDVDEVTIEYHVGKRRGNPKYNADGSPKMDSFSKWEWKFTIVGGQFDEQEATGETPAEYTTRDDDKVRQWSEALLGEELAVGAELDTDLLLGMECQIRMEHLPPRQGNDGTTYYNSTVAEVAPAGSQQSEEPPF